MQLNCEGVRLVWMCNGQNSWPEGRTRMRLSPLLIKASSVCGCPEPTQSLLRGAEDLLPARVPQVQDAGGSNGLVGQGRGMIPSILQRAPPAFRHENVIVRWFTWPRGRAK